VDLPDIIPLPPVAAGVGLPWDTAVIDPVEALADRGGLLLRAA
jgi:hypothetical protein